MKICNVSGKTLPEAYHNALYVLEKKGQVLDCHDYSTKEKIIKMKEVVMEMVVEKPLRSPIHSALTICDPFTLERYRREMLYGILDFENEWGYTYHKRIEDQIPYMVADLLRSQYSRRSVANTWDKTHDMDITNPYPACLQNIQFLIRPNEKGQEELNCFVLFRSNDAVEATYMNAYALINLQKLVRDRLNRSEKYKNNKLKIGVYVHRANSFHAYEKNFGMLEGYAKRIEDGGIVTLTNDEWNEIESKKEVKERIKVYVATRKTANNIK